MAAFGPAGKSVVTVGFDHTVRLWDIAHETELRQYTQHTAPVFCLAISADGKTLATGAQDNTIRIWDLPLAEPSDSIAAHTKAVNALALSPDGVSLISASMDHRVRIDSVEQTDRPGQIRFGHQAPVQSVAIRGDGAYFASSDQGGRIVLWSPYLEEPQSEWLSSPGSVQNLGFLSNQQLLSAGDDGVLRLWQASPQVPRQIDLGDVSVRSWSLANRQTQ
ncbi:MAG: hypothetical protein MI861_28660, partial [Pirellulales bacterium]|nr:hypothetical protein [Pirellulales bacterium]